jgi:CheY-like chemotaxis protein
MPPTDIAPAITVTSARLLSAALAIFGVVVVLALLIGVRRLLAARRTAVDAPLDRLRGFHIFGPDEDGEKEPVLHVPVIVARPVARATGAASPAPAARAPAAAPASVLETMGSLAVVARPVAAAPPTSLQPQAQPRLQARPLVAWNAAAPLVAPVATVPPPRREPEPQPHPQPEDQPRHQPAEVVLEGTAAAPPAPRRDRRPVTRHRVDERDPGDFGHILLVEDDETIASMYEMLLATRGYQTRHAHDGVEGIAMVGEELPSLILLDMMMPRMDGLQFLRALRESPRTSDLPVVILSNVGDRPLVEKAMQLGAIEYLVKAQTRPQVLLGALPHWLRGNRALTTLS